MLTGAKLCRKAAAVMVTGGVPPHVRSAMRARLKIMLLVFAALVAPRLHATGADSSTVSPVDPSACLSAISADDDDKVLGECGALIDNEKTAKADRLKALIARAGTFTRKDQVDRAIADYDGALRLDPSQADLFNARGELCWITRPPKATIKGWRRSWNGLAP
jgi:hypothetical protein